jgi:DNA-binding LacI/PurR family transcriptional regulator
MTKSSGPHVAASPGRDRAATIYDVAKFAGVSHQTVSRLLKGYEGIRPATRDRVERALRELEYRPNLTARLLTTGRSHRIGALTHEIGQFGPNQIVQGAAQAARRAGYVLDIVTLDMADRDAIAQSLDLVTQHDLAGVLVLAATDEMVESFRRIEFRVPVHLSADGEDDRGNGQMQEIDTVMRHLHGLGHRDFFHIAGPSNSPAGRHRSAAYEAALDAYGLSSDGTFIGDWSSASGFAAAALIPPTVTAVVAANDQMALGALLGLSRRGLRVPQDVSVTGIDDIPEAEYFSPPLTTIHLDFIARGASALTALMQQIDSEFPTVAPRPPRLVERMSSGPSRR